VGAPVVGFKVVGFDVAATVLGFEVGMGVVVLKWSFPASQHMTALFFVGLCANLQVFHL
jgi:hypothetical protein